MEENKEKIIIDNPTDTLFGEQRRISELSAASEEELKTRSVNTKRKTK